MMTEVPQLWELLLGPVTLLSWSADLSPLGYPWEGLGDKARHDAWEGGRASFRESPHPGLYPSGCLLAGPMNEQGSQT